MRLKNKSIIVTGAASGIGKAIALRLASEDANVIVNDINDNGGKKTVSEIKKAGGKAIFVHADMTKSDEVKVLIDTAIKKYKKLDVVINNAGWSYFKTSSLEVDEDDFDKCYAVNVKSVYNSVIHAGPIFKEQGSGSFINIASVGGIRPRPGLTWYNGAKGAVITTSKSLAVELGPDNIRVNCICPAFTPGTGLSPAFIGGNGELDEEMSKTILAGIPLGRFPTLHDISSAALYLASDDAVFVTGICLEVDGGRCI